MPLLPYLQSPTGNRTPPFRAGSIGGGFDGLNHWTPAWFSSGTAALAAAVRAAIDGAAGKRQITVPKVIVAAYGCPDIVAAIRCAGAGAIFVDVEPEGFRIDLQAARQAFAASESVVALIGVDLFGYPENWSELEGLCREFGASGIRDCAQSLQSRDAIDDPVVDPLANPVAIPVDDNAGADCLIYSFGRGKPLYLQGGGALLVPKGCESVLANRLAELERQWGAAPDRYARLRQSGYNLLLEPHLYALASRILGRRLGRTEYRALRRIERAPEGFPRLANAAIDAYWRLHEDRAPPVIERLTLLHREFPSLLHRVRSVGELRLNRVPVVVSDAGLRDRWMAALCGNGVSATDMYGRALPDIDGVEGECAAGGIENARSVASRLLTIPAHARLTDRDFDSIETTFRVACGNRDC